MNHRRCIWMCLLAAIAGTGCRGNSTMRLDPSQAYADARTKLLQAAEDPYPEVQTKALEALAATEGASAGPTMVQSLRSGSLPVQAAAAMAIAEVHYLPAHDLLLELIRAKDVPPRLQVALIYALHSVGDDAYTRELGRLLFSQDKWTRCDAVMVMGLMGEPSAAGPLKTVHGTDVDPVVRLHIMEALARLGDEQAMARLEPAIKSNVLDDQLIAVQAMGYVKTERSLEVLQYVLGDTRKDPIVRVAAAVSLARLKHPEAYDLLIVAAADPRAVLERARGKKTELSRKEVVNLRTLAILALGHYGRVSAVDELHELLGNEEGAVRVAAAKAILQLLAAYRPASPPMKPEPSEPPEPEGPTSRATSLPALHSAGGKD